MTTPLTRILSAISLPVSISVTAVGRSERDAVGGNLIQFNDNGEWCWYQGQRAVMDVAAGKLLLGSDASGTGVGRSRAATTLRRRPFSRNSR
jgi:hypothetical protein